MKTPMHPRYISWCKTLVLPSAAAALLIASPAKAADPFWWDPVINNGQIDAGSGTWDTSTSNVTWSSVSTGASNAYWTNSLGTGLGINAYFGPSSAPAGTYTISVGSGIQAQGITFNASGYQMTALTSTTLTLGYGAPGTITVSTGTAKISDNLTVSSLSGNPLTISGSGTLVIGASSSSAAATVKAGGNNNVNIQAGVTVKVEENGFLQSGTTATNMGTIVVGQSGTSTLTVNGGTVNNFVNLVLSNSTSSVLSTINLESGAISTGTATGVLRLGPTTATTSGTGILNLNGGTLSIGGITVGAAGSAVYNVNFNGGVLKATQSTTSFFASSSQVTANVLTKGAIIDTNGNNITIAQKLTGTVGDGGLTKQGLGILTLNGANTYNGATTVKQGTLALNASGSISSSSLVLGSSAGTSGILDVSLKGLGATYAQSNISGVGSIVTNAGTVSVNGVVAPGFSTGVLDIKGNLTLASSAAVQMEIASAGSQIGVDFDSITVEGTLNYGGSLTVAGYNGYDFAQAGSYNLFDFTAKSGDFSSVTVNNIALIKSGDTWTDASSQYSFDQSTGILNVALVPEPGTYAMLLGGLGMLGLLRRKLRR